MSSQDSAFSGSIPDIYDRCLGPMLFEPFATDLARRAAALAPERILETAAGTGIVTEALAEALPECAIIVTDLNQAMLDVAARRVGSDLIEFKTADASALPFGDGEFDLVVCQFGVMFFPDRIDAYREARRVLRRGGHFLFNAWGPLEASPLPEAVHHAVAALFPDGPPGFIGRTPHGYSEPGRIADDLAAAGFVNVEIEPVTLPSQAEGPWQPAVGFVCGSPLRMEIEARDPSKLDEAAEAATKAVAAKFGTGFIEAPMTANVVLARAP